MNWAGGTLIDPTASPSDSATALEIVNNWRSSHSFPLNTFQVTLRKKSREADARNPLIAQRIKRRSSIEAKLRRYSGMELSRMQDIGGCRSVVGSVAAVDALVGLYESSRIRAELVRRYDYLRVNPGPKSSGYRGEHLVYRYASSHKPEYEGLQIEIQIRTQLQHAWATAVETVGTFVGQALKSSQGEEKWLRFFALMGSELAFEEGTPPVPGTYGSRGEVRDEVRSLEAELGVISRLQQYRTALKTVRENAAHFAGSQFFLLELDAGNSTLTITGYPRSALDQAVADYERAEQQVAGRAERDAVLVSVESIGTLQRAFPNYFADTTRFLNLVRTAVQSS